MSFLDWQKFNVDRGDIDDYMKRLDSLWPLYDKYGAKYPSVTVPIKILGKWYGPGHRRATVLEFRDLLHQQEFFKINRTEQEIAEWNKETNKFVDDLTWSSELWGEIIPVELETMERTNEVNNLWYIQKWQIKRGKNDEAIEMTKKLLRTIYAWIKDFPEYSKMKARYFWQWYKGNTVFFIIEAENIEQISEATKKAFDNEEIAELNKKWDELSQEHSWEAEIWQIHKRPKED